MCVRVNIAKNAIKNTNCYECYARVDFQFEFHRDAEVTHALSARKTRGCFLPVFSNLIDQNGLAQHPIKLRDDALHETYPFSFVTQRRTSVSYHQDFSYDFMRSLLILFEFQRDCF